MVTRTFATSRPPGGINPLVAADVSYLDTFMSAADEQPVSLVDGDRNHDDEGARPDRAEHSVRMRDGLPASGTQRATDGEVALQRDGHQRQRAHSH